MKRTAFDDRRDQRVAEETGQDRAQYCAAANCPNRWSISSTRTCSAHAAALHHHWPQVTQEQLDAETDRIRVTEYSERVQHRHVTVEERRTILTRLRRLARIANTDPKAWARELQRREESGERLNDVQRRSWRAALGVRREDGWADDDMPAEREAA